MKLTGREILYLALIVVMGLTMGTIQLRLNDERARNARIISFFKKERRSDLLNTIDVAQTAGSSLSSIIKIQLEGRAAILNIFRIFIRNNEEEMTPKAQKSLTTVLDYLQAQYDIDKTKIEESLQRLDFESSKRRTE